MLSFANTSPKLLRHFPSAPLMSAGLTLTEHRTDTRPWDPWTVGKYQSVNRWYKLFLWAIFHSYVYICLLC